MKNAKSKYSLFEKAGKAAALLSLLWLQAGQLRPPYFLKAMALLVQPVRKSGLKNRESYIFRTKIRNKTGVKMSLKNSIDMKTLVTVFLGIWTMVIVCIVVGTYFI